MEIIRHAHRVIGKTSNDVMKRSVTAKGNDNYRVGSRRTHF